MDSRELREKRGQLVQQARDIVDAAEADGRLMTSEEREQWEKIDAEVNELGDQIRIVETQRERERELAEREEPKAVPARRDQRQVVTTEHRVVKPGDQGEALRAWFLAGSDKVPSPEQRETAERVELTLTNRNLPFRLRVDPLRSMADRKDWARRYEERAQSVGTGSEGGFTVPEGFVNELEVALLSFGGMREGASVLRTDSGNDLPWPTNNDTANEGMILGENTQVSEQDASFGQAILRAHKYSSKMLRVSVELIQDNAVNLVGEIGRMLGTRIGRITNRHFTVGTGTGEPEGIVTGATEGLVGASATGITYEELVDLEHSVDPAYRNQARWMFHDTTLAALKKLKDDQGRPLWLPGLAVREPDTILGYPYIVNQHMAEMAIDAQSILFGDLSKYKIRDVREVTLLRLDERFADFHQVAFLAFSRHDGLLLDAGTAPVKYFQNAAA